MPLATIDVKFTCRNAQRFLDSLPLADQIDFIRKRLELHNKALRKLDRKRKCRDEPGDSEDVDAKRTPLVDAADESQ